MEWKTKDFDLRDGMRRERLKFAWFPIKCEDRLTRWLCKVRVVEEYHVEMGTDEDSLYNGWVVLKVYRGEFETYNPKTSTHYADRKIKEEE